MEAQRRSARRSASAQTLPDSKLKQRLQQINSMSALWREKAPFLNVTTVSLTSAEAADLGLPEGRTHTIGPSEATQAFAHAWSKVFSQQTPVPGMAKPFLKLYASACPWDWSLASPPTNSSKDFLAHAKDSGPGWDGLPYSAWLNAGEAGHKLLDEVRDAIIDGEELKLANFGLTVNFFP